MTDAAAAEALNAHVEALGHDAPCVSDALKSLLSSRLAYASTGAAPAEPSVAKSVGSAAEETAAARAVLQAINAAALALPPPPQWALDYPQGDDEPFAERADVLGLYRAAHHMLGAVSRAGKKPSQLFGRQFLHATRLLPGVLASLRAGPPPAGTMPEQFASFVADLEHACAAGAGGELAQTVWAVDVNAAIRARQAERKADADGRNARAQQADALSDRLRAADEA